MNRRARRLQAREHRGKSLEWGKVQAQGTYADLGENDGRDLLMNVFRAVATDVSDQVFDDETLFNSTMTLISHGLLNIWFAVDGPEIRVRFQLVPPGGAA